MPIPQKQPNENDEQFMERCMGDEVMVRDYPERGQRYAVCKTQIQNTNMKVLIYGNIGEKIDGDAISQQLRDMAQTTDEIDVHINSYGGDVQQGVSIFSTIIALNNEGNQVNTYIDGFAASIASIIAVAGKKIFMNDFARIMVHEAFMGNNENLSENDKKALNEINDMLAQILSRRGVNKNSVAKKMREETWIRQEEAKELNLVDEIITTKSTVKQRAEVIMSSNEMKKAKQLSYINNLLGEEAVTKIDTYEYTGTQTQNTEKMDKLKAKLNLDSEDKIINKFDELNNKLEKLENEKSKLEKENEQLKKDKAEKVKAEVTTVIDSAIAQGKLSKENRENLIKQGENAPEAVKAMVNSMPEPSKQSLSDKWKNQNPPAGGGDNDEELAKEYQRMAENDPQGLQDLAKSNPDKFEKMKNAWEKA